MSKARFLNQKLGKRASRKMALLKSTLPTRHQPARLAPSDTRLPKK